MKMSPCIDTVFQGMPLKDAFAWMGRYHFPGFEFWFYKNYDLGELKALKEEYGLELANMNHDLIPLTDPGKRGEFLRELVTTLKYAKELGSRCVTVLSGDDTGADRQAQHDSITAGLGEAAYMASEAGVTIVLEASNRRVNRPHNYLTSADEAFAIVDEVGSRHVRMLYDIYHQQISEGDLLSRILPNMDKIGHFHAAGVPCRHELQNCEINYEYVFNRIIEAGYPNYVGLEYFPAEETETGLAWNAQFLVPAGGIGERGEDG